MCCSWGNFFGESFGFRTQGVLGGLVKDPLKSLLKNNFIYFSSAFIRKSFLKKAHVRFEEYSPVEDYKFWLELAKYDPLIYVETQPLVFSRVLAGFLSGEDETALESWEFQVKKEIVQYIVEQKAKYKTELISLYESACVLNKKGVLNNHAFCSLFISIFK